jgi:hypothetical protein
MKYLLITLLLLCPLFARAAPALLGVAKNRVVGTTSNPVNYTPSSGSTLIVWFNAATAETLSISDTQGNTWNVAHAYADGGTGAYLAVYYAQGVTNTADTVTISYGTAAASVIYLADYNGVGSFDKVSTVASGNSASPATSAVTPAQSGELALALIGTNASAIVTFSSWTGGFNQEDAYTASVPSGVWADQVLAGTGSVSGGATISASIRWSALTVLFEASGAPAGNASNFFMVGSTMGAEQIHSLPESLSSPHTLLSEIQRSAARTLTHRRVGVCEGCARG